MAKAGDSFEVTLKEAHLNWGTHRHTDTRKKRDGEGYIPIPAKVAKKLELKNGNATNTENVLGINVFNCQSEDGQFHGELKAQGCSKAKEENAKQFSIAGDLKKLGKYFQENNAQVGDTLEVKFTSSEDAIISIKKQS